ncbi:hypothetical protein [Deinococcus sp. UYEF24]
MTPGLPLNTAHAHTWAAVVSGTAWKRHTLEDGGTLTAEYARGPLILWAKRPGEGGSPAPQVEAPALSALEEYINHLNTAQVFERFKWAARGKVRHSVRWKTGRRPRRLRKIEALADLRFSVRMADRRAAGVGGFCVHFPALTAKNRRAAIRECEIERLEDRLRDIAPAWADEDNPNGWDADIIDECRGIPKILKAPRCRMVFEGTLQERISLRHHFLLKALVFHTLLKDKSAVRLIFRTLYSERLTLSFLLKAFERAEYRAHLTRRVKPAPRRHRIRRPLYARPRPPSAPLAPPVI